LVGTAQFDRAGISLEERVIVSVQAMVRLFET
jgi:hypothetical protein